MITPTDIFEFTDKKEWFNVGISYIHTEDGEKELRTAYFREQTILNAITKFLTMCDKDDQIITSWLFDEGDVEECLK